VKYIKRNAIEKLEAEVRELRESTRTALDDILAALESRSAKEAAPRYYAVIVPSCSEMQNAAHILFAQPHVSAGMYRNQIVMTVAHEQYEQLRREGFEWSLLTDS
jgi:hypothetical protein